LPYNQHPLLGDGFDGAVALVQMGLTEVLVAVDALEGSQVDVVLAVVAHVGEVLLPLRHHHPHVQKLPVLPHHSRYQLVLLLQNAFVLLQDLSGRGVTLSLNCSGMWRPLLMFS
jgi:hypothetical protein